MRVSKIQWCGKHWRDISVLKGRNWKEERDDESKAILKPSKASSIRSSGSRTVLCDLILPSLSSCGQRCHSHSPGWRLCPWASGWGPCLQGSGWQLVAKVPVTAAWPSEAKEKTALSPRPVPSEAAVIVVTAHLWITFGRIHPFSWRISHVCVLSHVQLFVTPWTAARQARLSMGFIRQDYWSGLPCPPPRDLPFPGIEPESQGLNPHLLCLLPWQVGSLPLVPPRKPRHIHSEIALSFSFVETQKPRSLPSFCPLFPPAQPGSVSPGVILSLFLASTELAAGQSLYVWLSSHTHTHTPVAGVDTPAFLTLCIDWGCTISLVSGSILRNIFFSLLYLSLLTFHYKQ